MKTANENLHELRKVTVDRAKDQARLIHTLRDALEETTRYLRDALSDEDFAAVDPDWSQDVRDLVAKVDKILDRL